MAIRKFSLIQSKGNCYLKINIEKAEIKNISEPEICI